MEGMGGLRNFEFLKAGARTGRWRMSGGLQISCTMSGIRSLLGAGPWRRPRTRLMHDRQDGRRGENGSHEYGPLDTENKNLDHKKNRRVRWMFVSGDRNPGRA